MVGGEAREEGRSARREAAKVEKRIHSIAGADLQPRLQLIPCKRAEASARERERERGTEGEEGSASGGRKRGRGIPETKRSLSPFISDADSVNNHKTQAAV